RTALFNLVLSGGLLPPPRRCARNEKKDKRSLVEKEIDTGACLIDARCKGFADAFLVCAHSKGVASADVRASRSGSPSVLQSSWRALHFMLPRWLWMSTENSSLCQTSLEMSPLLAR